MKKLALCLMLAVAILSVAVFPAAATPIVVPDYGETGWQTYSLTFYNDWKGTFGIGVSNYGDMEMDSKILIDNINIGPSGNQGFETGDFTGFSVSGSSNFIVTNAFSSSGNPYTPTESSYMAMLISSYSYFDAGGWTWIDYVDTSEWGGTNGAYITFPLDVPSGTTLTFDWAFLAGDEYPNADFAFVFGQPECGGPSLASCTASFASAMMRRCPEYFDILAQIGEQTPQSVPEPGTLLLLGCGILGVGLLSKKP